MGKIIANVVIKGGGAKTTSSLNIAYGLSKEGFRTILIDMDSSANASKTLMIKEKLSDDFVEIFQNKYVFFIFFQLVIFILEDFNKIIG